MRRTWVLATAIALATPAAVAEFPGSEKKPGAAAALLLEHPDRGSQREFLPPGDARWFLEDSLPAAARGEKVRPPDGGERETRRGTMGLDRERLSSLFAVYPARVGHRLLEEDTLLRPPVESASLRGRTSVRQHLSSTGEGGLVFDRTRVVAQGTFQSRMSPWIVDWSSRVGYGGGGALRDGIGDREPDFGLSRITVTRRFDDHGFFRAGRYRPGLPGIGQIDGVQGELSLGPFRTGLVAGLKPGADDLDLSGREHQALAYFSTALGARNRLHYRGTLGFLGTIYRGRPDRLAILLRQRADLGPKLSLLSSSEVDARIVQEERPNRLRLTGASVEAVTRVTSSLTLRAGVRNHKRPDIRAERDRLPSGNDWVFERGTWRYWVGGSQRLPLQLKVDGELSFLDSPDSEELARRWRVSLTRTGISLLRQARIVTTVYNLPGTPGYGGTFTVDLPLLERRLFLRPSLGFRFLETGERPRAFRVMDFAVHAHWQDHDSLSFHAGVSYSFADSLERTVVDVGLQLRW